MTSDPRQLPSGDTIPAAILRDFLLDALQHDAIHDVLTERVIAALERPYFVDRLRFRALGSDLPNLLAELIDAAPPEDWRAVAEVLIMDAREAMAEGGESQ